ncbi:MAG: class I SAM-dependent methyltransferase [Chloroflexales bacterium]|nr:class I SAM-dependent methyltransferase [Chloroflexales bacterium]
MHRPDEPDYLTFAADLSDPALVAIYDELPLWSAPFGALLLRHVPLRRGATVLDLGCGTGFPLLELAQRLGAASTVYGVDPWAASLERAREKVAQWGVPNVVLLSGDAATLPLPDQHLDLIVSNLGVNNFADPEAVLRECRRVARPRATLALTTNLQGHMHEFYAVFAQILQELGDHEARERLAAHIAHRTTVARLSAQLAAAQFQVTRVVEEQMVWRFADGSALLRHAFIKLGFLDDWKAVLPPDARAKVFTALEAALNRVAAERGELSLSIPMAYIEATCKMTGSP